MQKTKIEWVRNPDGTQGYSWNPMQGMCPYACEYCYARRMYVRYKWNPEIKHSQEKLNDKMPKKPTKIFVGSTFDIFHPVVESDFIEDIIDRCARYIHHTFIFLTKNPSRYAEFDFPKNCWLGTSTTGRDYNRTADLAFTKNGNLKFMATHYKIQKLYKIEFCPGEVCCQTNYAFGFFLGHNG